MLTASLNRHGVMNGYIRVRRLRLAPPRPDSHAWANRIRSELGWSATCGQPGHLVNTPFRRQQRLLPVDECVLREQAHRQLAEFAAMQGTAA